MYMRICIYDTYRVIDDVNQIMGWVANLKRDSGKASCKS